ncbi:MAG TPA: hypothetical protein VN667_14485 [Burkholderiales bacterium]|nr:hypothetical protein [Burkholderiales bacterium]
MTREPGAAGPEPARKLLTAKSEYAASADQLVSEARRELRIFDPALTEYSLENPARIERLRAFLRRSPANRLYIAVHDAEHVRRYCPRVVALLTLFSASMFIHRTQGDAARVQDCFVLADDWGLVRRPVAAQARGVYLLNDPVESAGMRKRFDEIWDSSVPGVAASTTGL